MGLETATYISGLTPSWPLPGDQKQVGDDHLRLIKSVLQATLPTASKPFYFPKTEVTATTLALDATDQHNCVLVDTSGGNVAVTLPSTLASGDAGWECEIVKTTNDVNAAIVSPSSGTIASKCGSTATIRVGILCEPARFKWTGTGWICSKPGPMIGSTESFDGATTPPGYLDDDGSSFSNTAYAELFAVLASSTLRDKRGRSEIGVDASGVNMSATYFGATPSLGATKSGSSATLQTINLPPYTPSGSIACTLNGTSGLSNMLRTDGAIDNAYGGGGVAINRALFVITLAPAATFTGVAQGGTSTPFSIVPPSIVVKKIKRAC